MIRPTDGEAPARDPLDELIDRACDVEPLPPYDEEPEPPRGPPLSADERRDAQLGLAMFQPPGDFIVCTKALCDRCNSEEWFNRPYLKFLHDAYVLAEFASLTSVESVRLAGASDQWPDGYAKLGTEVSVLAQNARTTINYFLLFHAHSGTSTPWQAAPNDVHTNRACFASRRYRVRNTGSLADRVNPNDFRPSMACLSLQALTISNALKVWRCCDRWP